jgi:hypothetical protein
MTNHIRQITVELIVISSVELADSELERAVRDDVMDFVRGNDYTILESCAYTRDENEAEELEALREIAHTYAHHGIQVAEWFVNEEGAQ